MTNTTTYLSPRNSSVMVDRTWAASLGLNQVPGARRVGNFYRLPRVAYLRALQAMREADAKVFEVPSIQADALTPAVRDAAAEVIAAAEQIAANELSQVAEYTQEVPVASRRSLSPCMGAAGLDSGSRRGTRVKAAA
jgi:DNA-directed RNA polymerase subunit K/omega